MQSNANIGITAIYCRLSRDDGTETDGLTDEETTNQTNG